MLVGQHGNKEMHLMLTGELQRLRQRRFRGLDVVSREQQNSPAEPGRDRRGGRAILGGDRICSHLRRLSARVITECSCADADHHAAQQRSLRSARAGWGGRAFEVEAPVRTLQPPHGVTIVASHKARLA